MEPGTYQVVTWAGLDKGSYAWNDPAETSQAVERAQDVKVRTLREANTTQPNELHPLWHSLDTFTVTRDMPEEKVISLAKNTNKLRVVLQNVMGEDMDVNNFSFRPAPRRYRGRAIRGRGRDEHHAPDGGPQLPSHHPSPRMGEGCAEREPQRLPPAHQDGGAPYLPAGVSGPAGRVFYHLLPYTEGMPRLSG